MKINLLYRRVFTSITGLSFFICFFLWRNFTVDDAFISWRHGKNLVEYGVYAFNSVGPRIEAATSPIFGIISVVPALLNIDVVLFFKFISLIILMLYIFSSIRYAESENRSIFLLLGISGPLQIIHIMSGLETGALIFFEFLLFAIVLGKIQVSKKAQIVVMGLLVLLRIEMFIPVLFSIYILVKSSSAKSRFDLFRNTCIYLVPISCVLLVLTVFRLAYFGVPLPNTFYTKSYGGRSFLEMLTNCLINFPGFIPFLAAATIAILMVKNEYRNQMILFYVSSILVAAAYLPSKLEMNFASRFAYQAFWPVVLAAVLVWDNSKVRKLIASIIIWLIPFNSIMECRALIDYYPRILNGQGALSVALNRVASGQSASNYTLVIGDVGISAYATNWRILDTLFLGTSRNVGELGIAREISKSDNTILALYSGGPTELPWESQRNLFEVSKSSGYKHAGSVCWLTNLCFQIYLSPDLAENSNVIKEVQLAITNSQSANLRNRTRVEDIIPWYWKVNS